MTWISQQSDVDGPKILHPTNYTTLEYTRDIRFSPESSRDLHLKLDQASGQFVQEEVFVFFVVNLGILVIFHQEFQVPKMEGFLNLIRLFWGLGFPLHKLYPYSLYRWGFLHLRYLSEMFGEFLASRDLSNDCYQATRDPSVPHVLLVSGVPCREVGCDEIGNSGWHGRDWVVPPSQSPSQ